MSKLGHYQVELLYKDGYFHNFVCDDFKYIDGEFSFHYKSHFYNKVIVIQVKLEKLTEGTQIKDLITGTCWVYRDFERIIKEENNHEKTCSYDRFYYLFESDGSAKVVTSPESDQ